MDWSESNLGKLMQLADVASEEEKEEPLASIDPPLIAAVRDPQYRSILLNLEEEIQKFRLQDSPIIEFPRFKTPYLRDIACLLAHHYGLEPLSAAESSTFCRTPGSRMPLLTLSSIPPPFEPERRVRMSKEMEEIFKDLGVIINPLHSSSISPVVPHSISPVHGGTIKEGGVDPNTTSALMSSMLAPLSLELPPPPLQPRSVAAQPPSTSVSFQNQDVVDFPNPMEEDEPNFSTESAQQKRRLRD